MLAILDTGENVSYWLVGWLAGFMSVLDVCGHRPD
jgi:hypothetical protein